jgi:fructokinase
VTADRALAEVLVIGEALIDVVHEGSRQSEHVGGSPTNVAYGLGRLGVRANLLTSLGRDERGEFIRKHVESAGVHLLPESWTDRRTSTSTAHIGHSGGATYEFDIHWELPAASGIDLAAAVHVGSIGAFLEPGGSTVQEVLQAASGRSLVSFDPNIRADLLSDREAALTRFRALLRLADVVKMSDEDAHWLYPGAAIDDVVDVLLTEGPQLVAITLGGSGSTIATKRCRVNVPARRVSVVDTIGAGDSFMAALIASLRGVDLSALTADDLINIGRRASVAAAITVSRAGAALPSREELDGFEQN